MSLNIASACSTSRAIWSAVAESSALPLWLFAANGIKIAKVPLSRWLIRNRNRPLNAIKRLAGVCMSA